MPESREHVISDLSIARPSGALADSPVQDKWIVLPYEGAVSGKMLWAPARSRPPDVAIPLPALGRCRIHVGIYSSGTYPLWLNVYRPPKGSTPASTNTINRLHLRLSDQDWYDLLVPDDYPGEPRFTYIAEEYWKTAVLTGQSLIIAPERRETLPDTTITVAYIRLEPTERVAAWPRDTRRLTVYYDSDFSGHYVASAGEVKSYIEPLRDTDFDTLLWTATHEDTCYYPTKVGNVISYGGPVGVYPFLSGRDMRAMLARGEDPLKEVCDTGHDCGLKVFASYRRLTVRMPPWVFPMHPNAFLMRRRDLWCADAKGAPVPHLSLTYPEVRRLMVDLFSEMGRHYDLDGVHMFFCRGVPFVFFEPPFLDAFEKEYGQDPRGLPLDDERVWRVRSRFVLQYLRELRAALDAIGKEKGRRLEVALTVMNSPRSCLFYGMDIEAMVRERLVDTLIPSDAHYLPRSIGPWHCTPETAAEFVRLTRGSGIQIRPICGTQYLEKNVPLPELAAAYYAAGVDGLQVGPGSATRKAYAVNRRLGHAADLAQWREWEKEGGRLVRVHTVGGLRFDPDCGVQTVG